MTYQLKSFKVLQTSTIAAVLYFFISLLVVVPLFLISLVIPNQTTAFPLLGSAFILLLPFLYAILGFVFSALGCVFYNLIATFMGGIAFTLEEKK